MPKPVYRGVFPVAPTVFDKNGELDLEGQKRCTDFMIDAGSGEEMDAIVRETFQLPETVRAKIDGLLNGK